VVVNFLDDNIYELDFEVFKGPINDESEAENNTMAWSDTGMTAMFEIEYANDTTGEPTGLFFDEEVSQYISIDFV
jgi:hypothetical protein